MKTSLIVLALATLAGVATVGHAQDAAKASAEAADDPDASSVGTGSTSRIVLEAGDADAKATVRLAGSIGGNDDFDGRYALTVSAPFDRDKADRVDVGSLSGLTAGTSATLEFGVRRWKVPSQDQRDAMTAVCEEHIPKLIPGYSWEDINTVATVACDDYAFDSGQLDDLVKRINERRTGCAQCREVKGEAPPLCETLRKARQQSCVAQADGTPASGDAAVCALLEKETREECAACKDVAEQVCSALVGYEKPAALTTEKKLLVAARAAARPVAIDLFRPLTIFTVGLTANTQHFTYLLDDNIDTVNNTDKGGVGITFAATHVLRTSAWSLGYSHEESYEGAKEIQLCRPLGTTGASTCSAAALGAPEKQKAELAFLQHRVAFAAGRLALAPRVEFDVKESNWAARVPFYFIANKAHELTAGLAVGYTEGAEEEFGAAVFISKAFSFY